MDEQDGDIRRRKQEKITSDVRVFFGGRGSLLGPGLMEKQQQQSTN